MIFFALFVVVSQYDDFLHFFWSRLYLLIPLVLVRTLELWVKQDYVSILSKS